MLVDPEVLITRVIKIKYFLDYLLLREPTRSSTSLVWKGLLEGRNVLLKGMQWQVGNGERIIMWKDLWILGCYGLNVGNHSIANPNLIMKDLISMGQWDINLLRTLFPPHLVNQIYAIYISDAEYEDELI